MGFRKDSYATVWEVNPKTEVLTIIRISTSKKDKNTGTYEQDFSGFVACVGKNAAAAACKLHEKDRIKLGDVDVTTKYDKEKKITYTNFACFGFELADKSDSPSQPVQAVETPASEGENPNDGVIGGDNLPF